MIIVFQFVLLVVSEKLAGHPLHTCDVILNNVQLPLNTQQFYCIGVYTKLDTNQNVYCSVNMVTSFFFFFFFWVA